MSTMKETILNTTDDYFVYQDVASALPGHPRHSIMGRIHELIDLGLITRVRSANYRKGRVAIYRKN